VGAFLLSLQQAAVGYGEITQLVVHRIHGLSHLYLSLFFRKQWQLLVIVLQVGETDTQQPDLLFNRDTAQDGRCCLIDFITLVDVVG
jgi:hypothetical protein